MKDLLLVKIELDNQISVLRSIIRLIDKPQVIATFEKANEVSQKEALKHIKDLNRQEITNWLHCELGNPNIRNLRTTAKKYGVLNYSRLSKAVLLSEISRCQRLLKAL